MGVRGEWDSVKAWLGRAMRGGLSEDAREKVMKTADAIAQEAKNHIANQDMNWAPLLESTVASKGFKDVYIETREFSDSIHAELVEDKRFRTTVFVGPSDKGSRKGISFQELAEKLEYGTSLMVARPLWRPLRDKYARGSKWKKFGKLILGGINWNS